MPSARVSLESSVLKVGNTKEEDVLIGSRCTECGRYFFPQRKRCAHCTEPTTELVELSTQGVLSSYSFMTRKPRYCLIEPPYTLGEVKTPEGISIYTVINVTSPEKLRLGQRVILDTVEIEKDEEGNSVIAYRFTPIE